VHQYIAKEYHFELIFAGVYIKFEIQIFSLPPFLIYIFSPNEIYYNEVVRAAGGTFSAIFFFFFNFCTPGYLFKPNKPK